ncbi:MAG: hypothetical protein PWP23_3186 [Candidatus Sumerlaeota bacterium]|nr:hypothetical protein [Candidatus Sumerlaeota bacterium]
MSSARPVSILPHKMEPIRICRVINAMWTGGVQVRLLALLPVLKERGCLPHVVTLRTRGELAPQLEELGIPCTHLRIQGRLHPPSLNKLRRFFLEQRFHVVHTHMYQANVSGTAAARLAGVPCVVSQMHNVDMYQKRRQAWTDRLMMPLRDRMLAVSEAVALNTARHLRIAPERIGVLHNGIDTTPPPGLRSRADVLDELRLPADSIVIIHVARLHAQKNHQAFLREFPRILKIAPSVRLLLVGQGNERHDLEQLVRELDIHRAVRFLGNRTDVPELLNAADISILPSLKEGFSNVILESMVHRAALVVTDVGGAREQLRDSIDGYIVPHHDMTAFRELVTKVAMNPGLRERLTTSAATRVQEFSIARMADRTLAIYEDVLRRKKAWPGATESVTADEPTA